MPRLTYERDLLSRAARLELLARPSFAPIRRWAMRTALRLDYAPPTTPAARAEVAAGLRNAFPALDEGALDSLAARHLRSVYRSGVAWQLLSASTRGDIFGFIDATLDVEGREHLDAAASGVRPVIIVSPHYGLPVLGCIEVIRMLRGRKRVNTFFASPEENSSTAGYPEVFERLDCDVQCILVDSRAVVRALKALRNGDALTMQPDVFENRKGTALLLPSLGGVAQVMGGTAFLALRSDAVVIPAFCFPTAGGRFRMRVDPPLDYQNTGDVERDTRQLALAIQRSCDEQLERLPDPWLYWQELPRRMLPGVRLRDLDDADEWRAAWQGVLAHASRVVPEVRREFAGPRADRRTQLAAVCEATG